MNYVFLAIISAIFFGLTFFLRKLALKTISLSSALTIEAIVEVLVVLLIIKFLPLNFKEFNLHNKGFLFAVLTGLMVALGVAFNYFALKGGFLSKVIPIAAPSQIIFSVILGFIILGEFLTWQQILGILLSILGIILMVR